MKPNYQITPNYSSLFQKQHKEKVQKSKLLIDQWVKYAGGEDNVFVAFSGGLDSTVLLHLCRSVYPEIEGVFCNTGVEYPEIYKFVRSTENIKWLKPKIPFKQVIKKYGWPVISKEQAQSIHEARITKSDKMKKLLLGEHTNKKFRTIPYKYRYLLSAPFLVSHKCCYFLKKYPTKKYEKTTGKIPFLGIRNTESKLRRRIKVCNNFDEQRPVSYPILHWTKKDVWYYMSQNNIKRCNLYDLGWESTGCAFCLFGVQTDSEPNRFQRMAITHPRQLNYFLYHLNGIEVLNYMNIPYKPSNTSNRLF